VVSVDSAWGATLRSSLSKRKSNWSKKEDRLIDWNTEQILRLLKEIQARRIAMGTKCKKPEELQLERRTGEVVLDEVREIIVLLKVVTGKLDTSQVLLSGQVI
jgi:hypothetical protein